MLFVTGRNEFKIAYAYDFYLMFRNYEDQHFVIGLRILYNCIDTLHSRETVLRDVCLTF